MTDLADLAEQLKSIRTDLDRMRDLEDIKRLKYLYCKYADVVDGVAPVREFSTLFTENAIWDIGGFVTVGRDAIEVAAAASAKRLRLAFHTVTCPLIEIRGDEATARWNGIFPLLLEGSSDISWLAGIYADHCVRTPSGWLFDHVKIEFNLGADALAT